MNKGIYEDDAAVDALTKQMVADGFKLFQMHKLSSRDLSHVDALLGLMKAQEGERILDMGCGIGEQARIMKQIRPDLDIVLQNISPSQLLMCPDEFEKICGDFHNVNAPDASFDGIMFNYSFGHGDVDMLLTECYRLLKRGGWVFLWDFAGENTKTRQVLNYRTHYPSTMIHYAAQNSFELDYFCKPPITHANDFYDKVMPKEQYDVVFKGVVPAIWRFVKEQ